MKHLERKDLWSLEQYAEHRPDFRAKVIRHKDRRRVHIGPNASLYFEDRLTIQYQIQEMLRIERIFDAGGINEELESYNPLIPDGCNWKATLMVEFPDVEERRQALGQLVGIENVVWVQAGGLPRIWAVADEDLDRATEDKTSAVHFLRFELTREFAAAVKGGADINIGIEHEQYSHSVMPLAEEIRDSLNQDLD